MYSTLETILKRVKDSKIPVSIIANETGISSRWLYAVLAKKITRPDYNQVIKLAAYLDNHFELLAKHAATVKPAATRRQTDKR